MNSKEQIINDYINGNLTDAKRRAKRFTGLALIGWFEDAGYGAPAASAIAAYLKGKGSFQDAADAEHADNKRHTASYK